MLLPRDTLEERTYYPLIHEARSRPKCILFQDRYFKSLIIIIIIGLYTAGLVSEPCGYAVLLLISIIQKTVPCGQIKDCGILVAACACRSESSPGEEGGRGGREKREGILGGADGFTRVGRPVFSTM